MADYRYLELRRDGATLVATINNPPQNFLNATIVQELTLLAGEVTADESVRALVLTGGVDGIFITHYDVGELAGASDVARDRESFGAGGELHGMHKLLLALQDLRVPVIAAINGTAMGGGCELALACDFRIKSTEGVMGLPEVRVGILPGAGGTQRMTRLLGVARAMELLLLGNTVDGATAERIGLVHRAVAPERVLEEALELAGELAKRPPLSIALIKQCILKGSGDAPPRRAALRARGVLEDDALRGRRPAHARVPEEQPAARPAMTIRAVLFDVGGPLATEIEHERAIDADIRSLFAEAGIQVTDKRYAEIWRQVVDSFAPNAYEAVIWQLATGDEETAPSVYREVARRSHERGSFQLREGMPELLAKLSDRGLRLGLAANQPAEVIARLEQCGIARYFDSKAVSGVHGYCKPDVRLFLHACEALGVTPEECIMVGDRIDCDIVPAKSLGMRAVRLRSGRHASQEARSPDEGPDAEAVDVPGLRTAIFTLLD